MGTTLHEGWVILTFADGRPPHAGLLRYERVGGTLHQWVLAVPAAHHHSGYDAIVDPLSIATVTPCTEERAVALAQTPAPLRDPPAA